jgi:hypothetical protein
MVQIYPLLFRLQLFGGIGKAGGGSEIERLADAGGLISNPTLDCNSAHSNQRV